MAFVWGVQRAGCPVCAGLERALVVPCTDSHKGWHPPSQRMCCVRVQVRQVEFDVLGKMAMVQDIARGCEYLALLNFVHRYATRHHVAFAERVLSQWICIV